MNNLQRFLLVTVLVTFTTVSSGPVLAVGADFNNDGIFSVEDLDLLIAAIAFGSTGPDFDLTDDEMIDQFDIAEWLNIGGNANRDVPYNFADVNLDGNVDQLDFATWNDNRFTQTGTWSDGDFNGDGLTDGQDFLIWNDNKTIGSSRFPVSSVPEPSGLFLVLPALMLLARRRK